MQVDISDIVVCGTYSVHCRVVRSKIFLFFRIRFAGSFPSILRIFKPKRHEPMLPAASFVYPSCDGGIVFVMGNFSSLCSIYSLILYVSIKSRLYHLLVEKLLVSRSSALFVNTFSWHYGITLHFCLGVPRYSEFNRTSPYEGAIVSPNC